MKSLKNQKGITLTTLAIMVIVILIISGVGIASGAGTIKYSKYLEFQSELKMVQSKVNEISEQYIKENIKIGEELTADAEKILDVSEVNEELNKKANSDAGKLQEIKNGFRFCSKEYLSKVFGLDGLNRDYLINLDPCIVISNEFFDYEGVNYYMLEQMEGTLYNVTYNNQIEPTGSFVATYNKVENGYQITIEVDHNKYVSKWQVKYRLQDSQDWNTTTNLTFTVQNPGTYVIQVVHGDEVDLGEQTLIVEEGM